MTEDEKELYLLHAKTKGYKRRMQEAFDVAERAISEADGKMCISYSGGKDSTVMLDLCMKAGFRGDMMQFYYSEYENPYENVELAKLFSYRYGLHLRRIKCFSAKEAWDAAGRFFVVPSNDFERSLVRKVAGDFGRQSDKISKEQGYQLHFIGMRKEESKRRKLTLCDRGLYYYAKTREAYTCCPVGNLTSDDVWAYIVENHLPYISCYDNDLYDRRRIRNEPTYFCIRDAVFQGAVETYCYIYPEIFAKIRCRYKGTGNYF